MLSIFISYKKQRFFFGQLMHDFFTKFFQTDDNKCRFKYVFLSIKQIRLKNLNFLNNFFLYFKKKIN